MTHLAQEQVQRCSKSWGDASFLALDRTDLEQENNDIIYT